MDPFQRQRQTGQAGPSRQGVQGAQGGGSGGQYDLSRFTVSNLCSYAQRNNMTTLQFKGMMELLQFRDKQGYLPTQLPAVFQGHVPNSVREMVDLYSAAKTKQEQDQTMQQFSMMSTQPAGANLMPGMMAAIQQQQSQAAVPMRQQQSQASSSYYAGTGVGPSGAGFAGTPYTPAQTRPGGQGFQFGGQAQPSGQGFQFGAQAPPSGQGFKFGAQAQPGAQTQARLQPMAQATPTAILSYSQRIPPGTKPWNVASLTQNQVDQALQDLDDLNESQAKYGKLINRMRIYTILRVFSKSRYAHFCPNQTSAAINGHKVAI